jgi:hypothetical protein
VHIRLEVGKDASQVLVGKVCRAERKKTDGAGQGMGHMPATMR